MLLIVAVSPYCLAFCDFLGESGLSYSSDDDQYSLVLDTEGQMDKFVAKTLRVCSRLVVLTYWTLG